MTHTELINDIIVRRGYRSYLEVGVENPENNYNKIVCKYKECVDPYEDNMYISDEQAEELAKLVTYRMTSDNFFECVHKKYDLIFIDAKHTEEQCNRDIWNAEQHLTDRGCIVVHDVLPETEELQSDEPRGGPWCGTVWKSILSLVRMQLPVRVIDDDYGMAVIEKCSYKIPAISMFMYKYDFKKTNMNVNFEVDNYDKTVSYFTPLHNTTVEMIKRAYKSLFKQTRSNWQWVLLADSKLDDQSLRLLTAITQKDYRVKYYTMRPNSNGTIGEAKYRASLLCEGFLVAELDHDDVLMPLMTSKLYEASLVFPDDGFFYCDNIECDNNFEKVRRYPDGFALGYGKYKVETLNNPLTDQEQEFDVVIQPGINPATIRHIVGIPNHVRCWRKEFLMQIGGYNRYLPIADDYELIIRTFLNTKMCYIPYAGYLQVMHGDNSQNGRRTEIQHRVKSIANHYHKAIAERFKQFGLEDWVYKQQPDSADYIWKISDGSKKECVNDIYDMCNE